eukprot:scaffold7671_cov417-Prasinococcus_capsulatus_cf.AAC.1
MTAVGSKFRSTQESVSQPRGSLAHLPPELLARVLSFLPEPRLTETLKLSVTSKQFHEVGLSDCGSLPQSISASKLLMRSLDVAEVKQHTLTQGDLELVLRRLPRLRRLEADLWLVSDTIAAEVSCERLELGLASRIRFIPSTVQDLALCGCHSNSDELLTALRCTESLHRFALTTFGNGLTRRGFETFAQRCRSLTSFSIDGGFQFPVNEVVLEVARGCQLQELAAYDLTMVTLLSLARYTEFGISKNLRRLSLKRYSLNSACPGCSTPQGAVQGLCDSTMQMFRQYYTALSELTFLDFRREDAPPTEDLTDAGIQSLMVGTTYTCVPSAPLTG